MPAVTKSFSYDPERDRDVHAWIEALPGHRGALSEALIRAIRCSIRAEQGTPSRDETLALILDRLDRIEARLGAGVPTGTRPEPPELPGDVLAALNDLAT